MRVGMRRGLCGVGGVLGLVGEAEARAAGESLRVQQVNVVSHPARPSASPATSSHHPHVPQPLSCSPPHLSFHFLQRVEQLQDLAMPRVHSLAGGRQGQGKGNGQYLIRRLHSRCINARKAGAGATFVSC